MSPIQYNEELAATYDRDVQDMFEPQVLVPAVDFLTSHAHGGPVLEFGIGTGRVSLPLSARGLSVHGIDESEAMLERLRSKGGSETIQLATGDFSSTRVDGRFTLVYLVFNTIMNLTTQEAQIACFQNAADHLEPRGRFVIEVLIPRLRNLPPGERVQPFDVAENHLGFDEYTSFADQILRSHHYWNDDGKFRHVSAPYRWVWPAELNLMARLAGMRLIERWGSWTRTPFTDESASHVSVWELVR